jgi:hypothetical protein
MSEEKDTWNEYSKLVLKELERLNENHEKMRYDFDNRFNEINSKLSEVKTLEKNIQLNINWIDRVNDVWSPSQMKEAKDEIYRQKTVVAAAIAIITFVQVIIGIGLSLWSHVAK